MTESITEGRLRFDFREHWQALKFDDTRWYRDVMNSEVKAVDIVSVSQDGKSHWWVEIKDCLGFEPDNHPRLSPTEAPEVGLVRQWVKAQGHNRQVKVVRTKSFIVDEVAEKLEGTLVSMMAAVRNTGDAKATEVIAKAGVLSPVVDWHVVLLLTWDPTARDFRRLAMRLREKLNTRLAAYRLECFVLNEADTAPNQPWTVTRVS